MIPYKIKFVLDEKSKDEVFFESNEKPFKGEVYTIQAQDGNLSEFRITEVTKVITRKSSVSAMEYHCKVERHEETTNTIGFGKRS